MPFDSDVFSRWRRQQAEETRYRAEICDRARRELALLREEQRARDRAGVFIVPPDEWSRHVRAAVAADIALSFPTTHVPSPRAPKPDGVATVVRLDDRRGP